MSKISDAQTGISIAGGAASIGLSFIPGVGPAAGGAAAGVTSMINAILGLADTPEAPKVPAAERQAAGVGSQALAGLASQSGLNAQQVGYIGQVGRERQITDAITTSTLAQGLSPYDKKRIFDKLRENNIGANQAVADTVQKLDPIAEANRYANVIQGSATVAGSYGAIHQQETTAQYLNQEYKKAAATSFAASMTKIAKNIGGIFAPPADQNKIPAVSADKAVTAPSPTTVEGNKNFQSSTDQKMVAVEELAKIGITAPTNNQIEAYLSLMSGAGANNIINANLYDANESIKNTAQKQIESSKRFDQFHNSVNEAKRELEFY